MPSSSTSTGSSTATSSADSRTRGTADEGCTTAGNEPHSIEVLDHPLSSVAAEAAGPTR